MFTAMPQCLVAAVVLDATGLSCIAELLSLSKQILRKRPSKRKPGTLTSKAQVTMSSLPCRC